MRQLERWKQGYYRNAIPSGQKMKDSVCLERIKIFSYLGNNIQHMAFNSKTYGLCCCESSILTTRNTLLDPFEAKSYKIVIHFQ